MSLLLLTLLIFVIIAGLLLTAAYFLLAIPLARRDMRTRLAAIGEGGATTAVAESDIFRQDPLNSLPALKSLLSRLPFLPRLQLFIEQAGMTIPAGALIVISFGLALFPALIGLTVWVPMPLILMGAGLCGMIPFSVVAIKRGRRFNRFQEIFPEAIDLLARAVRAGHAFTTGFSLIADELAEPVASEFRITWQQQNLGLSLSEALQNLCMRVPLPDVHVFVSALLIQRETGGNLAEILDNLSHIIRERAKLFRQVQILTTEGRMSMYTLMVLPILTGVAVYFANPKYTSRLLEDPIGHVMLIAGAVMMLMGYFVIRRIIRIKI